MTRADFTSFGNVDGIYMTTADPQTGVSSLRVGPTDGTLAMEVLDASLTASVTEGRIVSEVQARSARAAWLAFYFRFQDLDNWYELHVTGGNTNAFTDPDMRLRKRVGGTISTVASQSFGNNCGNLNQCINLSAGAPTDWTPIRLDFWVDSGGDFRVRLEEDGDRDGNWTQLLNDLVDPSPDLGGGGGMAVGSPSTQGEGGTTSPIFYDETEFYF